MPKCIIPSTSKTFAKEKRIRKRRDFLRLQRFGSRAFGRSVVVIAQRSEDLALGRLGITVPKKIGAAHVRNKIKRRIRHIFRLKPELFFKKSIVVVARSTASSITFRDLELDITETIKRLKLPNRGHL